MVQLKMLKHIKAIFLLKLIASQGRPLRKSLPRIEPCSFAKDDGNHQMDAASVRLDPTHDFMMEKGILYGERSDSLFGKNGLDNDHV